MQIELSDQIIDALREAFAPLIERLIDEKVEQRRPLLLSVNDVAEQLSCSRASVYGLIHGGHLEAVRTGRTYRIAATTIDDYVEELTRPSYQREIVRTRSAVGRGRSGSASSRKSEPMRSDVLSASRPPRQPRPKREKRVSKEEFAEMRWTVDELAERWWGPESARALLDAAGVEMNDVGAEGQTFRYGDLLTWVDENKEGFHEWLEKFDPYLNQHSDNAGEANVEKSSD